MRKVISVNPLEGKKLAIVFSDGLSGIFDVTPYIRGDFFSQLQDDAYFRQVRLFFCGIGWPNGQDLGPDTIEADLVKEDVTASETLSQKQLRLVGE